MSDRPGTTDAPRLRDGLRPCLITFLAVRIGLIVLAAIATGLFPARDAVNVPGWITPPFSHGWPGVFTAFERQDALWFLRIATTGYAAGDGSAAFFPLYPLVVRAASWIVGGHPLLGATLVSNVAFFGSLLVLYDLTVRELSRGVARRTIVYIAIFPTAFFFFAPYSESLFLLLSLIAFREARRGRWTSAAAAGALAALTRSIGVVLAPALIVMALERRDERGLPWPRMIAGATVLLGPLAYLGWWALAHGEALAPIHAQANWQREAAFPLSSLWNALEMASPGGVKDPGYWIIDILVVGVVIMAVVAGWRRLPLPYLTYALGSLLIPLSYPFPPRPLLSMPRFVAVIFPAFWILADAVERRRLSHTAVVATFVAGLSLLAVLFMNWWYIF
ncbi:MAG: mannosyltransferase family protein [Actinomycetota bacterium]